MLWNKFPSKSVELICKNERNQRDLIDIYAVLNFLLKDKRLITVNHSQGRSKPGNEVYAKYGKGS